jgi:hypothetical protein
MLIGAGLAERVIGHRVGLAAFGTAAVMGATMLWIGLAPIGLAIVAVAFILGSGLLWLPPVMQEGFDLLNW